MRSCVTIISRMRRSLADTSPSAQATSQRMAGDIPENVVHQLAHDDAAHDGGKRLGVVEDRVVVGLRRAERAYADRAIAGGEAKTLEGLLRGRDLRLVHMAVCLGELRHHRADGSEEDDLAFTRGTGARRCMPARIAIRPLRPRASSCDVSGSFAEEVADLVPDYGAENTGERTESGAHQKANRSPYPAHQPFSGIMRRMSAGSRLAASRLESGHHSNPIQSSCAATSPPERVNS